MSEKLEDIITSLEQRISNLEGLVQKERSSIIQKQSNLQNANTARRINVNSNCFIDADGRVVVNKLELNGLDEVSSASYLLSISAGVVSIIPVSDLSGAVLPIYSGDPDTNGTWKIHADDGNFHVQCRINGTYYDQILQTPTSEE